MANYPGNYAYPQQWTMGGQTDDCVYTKRFQTGIARGGTTSDYNATLRGLHKRTDKKPKKPYP